MNLKLARFRNATLDQRNCSSASYAVVGLLFIFILLCGVHPEKNTFFFAFFTMTF